MYPAVDLAKWRQILASHQIIPQWCSLSDQCSHLGFMNRKDSSTGIKLLRIRIKIFCDSEGFRIYCHTNCGDVLQSII